MKIALAADHGGFQYKQALKETLAQAGHQVIDLGAQTRIIDDDYPEFAMKVAEAVSLGEAQLGILLCRTGAGMCMVANKYSGVRAAASMTPEQARLAREHNHANVLCLGADEVSLETANSILTTFITTSYDEAERHTRRVSQIERLDEDISRHSD